MFEILLKKIAKELDTNNIPYMIIGGQAVLLYGVPRLTRDIDITLGLDSDNIHLIKNICKKFKFKILVKNPDTFVKDTKVLPVEDSRLKIRVDFIFSFTSYEIQAIKRANLVNISGYKVRFASLEDIIIHKLFANRAIDIEDVKNILIKNKGNINIKYTRRWLKEFCNVPDQENILKNFNKLLRNT